MFAHNGCTPIIPHPNKNVYSFLFLLTNKNYDSKMEEAANTTDDKTRWELLKEAEGICMDDYAVTPIFQVGGASLISKKVKGIETHAVGVPYIYKNVEVVE